MSTSSPYVLGPNASISEVLDGITRAHGLDRDAVPELVEKFNQHMVIKMSHLMRLQPQQLQKAKSSFADRGRVTPSFDARE